jgi:hypothetical protein
VPSALYTEQIEGISARDISAREAGIVRDILHEFASSRRWRNVFAGQWEEAAQLILPTSRNTFFYGNYNTPGAEEDRQQVDATGMLALHRFAAICDSLLTPRNMKWHQLSANNDYVMKDRATRLWFEQVADLLFKHRYAPHANFAARTTTISSRSARSATPACSSTARRRQHNGARGLRYKAIPLGETVLRREPPGRGRRVIRWFKLTAYQAAQKWGIDRAAEPAQRRSSRTASGATTSCTASSRARLRPGPARRARHAVLVALRVDRGAVPDAARRAATARSRCGQPLRPGAGEVYGRGPRMMVLPALKTLNAEKRTFLKQGHRAADPVLLVATTAWST